MILWNLQKAEWKGHNIKPNHPDADKAFGSKNLLGSKIYCNKFVNKVTFSVLFYTSKIGVSCMISMQETGWIDDTLVDLLEHSSCFAHWMNRKGICDLRWVFLRLECRYGLRFLELRPSLARPMAVAVLVSIQQEKLKSFQENTVAWIDIWHEDRWLGIIALPSWSKSNRSRIEILLSSGIILWPEMTDKFDSPWTDHIHFHSTVDSDALECYSALV